MEQSEQKPSSQNSINLELNAMPISNFDPSFPPLHKAVFDEGEDDAVPVAALIANPPQKGLQLETLGEFEYYDCTIIGTTLGTAVYFYSSVATIEALLKAGANPLAHISVDHHSKTPLQCLRDTRKQALDQGTIEEFGEFWMEFCGRAPTASWFNQVEALLVAAEKAQAAKLVAASSAGKKK